MQILQLTLALIERLPKIIIHQIQTIIVTYKKEYCSVPKDKTSNYTNYFILDNNCESI